MKTRWGKRKQMGLEIPEAIPSTAKPHTTPQDTSDVVFSLLVNDMKQHSGMSGGGGTFSEPPMDAVDEGPSPAKLLEALEPRPDSRLLFIHRGRRLVVRSFSSRAGCPRICLLFVVFGFPFIDRCPPTQIPHHSKHLFYQLWIRTDLIKTTNQEGKYAPLTQFCPLFLFTLSVHSTRELELWCRGNIILPIHLWDWRGPRGGSGGHRLGVEAARSGIRRNKRRNNEYTRQLGYGRWGIEAHNSAHYCMFLMTWNVGKQLDQNVGKYVKTQSKVHTQRFMGQTRRSLLSRNVTHFSQSRVSPEIIPFGENYHKTPALIMVLYYPTISILIKLRKEIVIINSHDNYIC